MTSAKPAILVIDDDPDIRASLCDILADRGHDVVTCENGLRGLDALRANATRVCIVLLDLMMPVMDGWEFRRRQLADPALAGVPVVVMSASTAAAAQGSLHATFLAKPFSIDQMLACVTEHC